MAPLLAFTYFTRLTVGLLSPARIEGVLEIKMGGKSMTLSQRIAGPRVGACLSGR